MFTTFQKAVFAFLLIFSLCLNRAEASTPHSPPDIIDFEHLTLDHGLVNPVVYDIVRDRHGFLWFATGNGVSRYDGYEFHNYLPETGNPYAIGIGPVIQLSMDSKQRLWALVVGSGAYLYDEKRDSFVSLKQYLPGSSTLSSDNVYSMAEDKDGNLWISTIDGGLNRIDESKGIVTHLRKQEGDLNSLPSDQLTAIFIDSENALWISTIDCGLIRYDIETAAYTTLIPDIPQSIEIAEDRFGDVWIPTLGKGVVRYIRSENRFVTYSHHGRDPNSLSHNQVVKTTEDKFGTLWLTTWGGGLNIFDRNTDSFKKHQNSPGRSGSINDNNTWGIYTDNTGVIWVGTYGSGINKYDRKTERFPLMRHNPSDPNSLRNNNVKAIFQDSHGEIWFGTLGGGLSRFQPESGAVTHYIHAPDDPESISNNSIWGIAEDSSHDLWIATEYGLNKFDRRTGRFIHYLHDPADPHTPGSNLIRSVLVDSKDNVWFGTQLVGVDRYDRKENRFYHYAVDGPHNIALYEDSLGGIWNGNIKTVSRYDPLSDTFHPVPISTDQGSTGSMGFYVSIKEDNNNRIWIASTQGLKIITHDGHLLKSFGTGEGLNDEVIADFQFDPAGGFWVSTTRGISVYNESEKTFKNYEIGSFNRGASVLSKDGTLYFGGKNGVRHFSPEGVEDNHLPPPIAVTDFTVANKQRKLDAPLSDLPDISLTHHDRLFAFEFAALDFSNPQKNRYRYKLQGFDKDWTEVSSRRRFATYTNLDAGSYLFQVTGSNSDGVWNPAPVSIGLTIVPPWWETWWFYSLAAFAVLGSLGLLYQSKVRKLKNELLVSQRLRESEEKFRIVFENSPLGIVFFNEQGRITACNDLFCTILDRPKDKVVSHNLEELESRHVKKAVQLTLQGEINHFHEKNLTLADRKSIAVRAMFGPVYDAEGNISGGIGILEDITDQVKTEKEAARLEAKLQQSMKMEAIGTLAGGIAHDFNNILGVILGYSDIAKQDVKKNLPARVEADLEKITQAGIRAKELVQQILTFSRQSDTETTLLDPSSLLTEILKMLRSTLPATITIEAEVEEVDKWILANRIQMHQVVMNLCTNAYHAMETTGGKLTIHLKEIELNNAHLLRQHNAKPGPFIRLLISDTGIGIPDAIQHRIFEPYYTTKDVGKGTGMGLAIIHGIIQSYGGFISFDSRAGEGTTFRIYLPAQDRQVEVPAGLKKATPVGSERILLVDDEEMLVAMGREMLEQLGYTVTTSTSSSTAYELFKASPHSFDLVITDQTMPGMTGEELAINILSIRGDIPIILCTGYSSLVTEEEAKRAGIKAFALKPLVKEEIATMVRSVLDA